jgi:hypothetical protein
MPLIQDILSKRAGYKYFTKLDISMQYYTFELTEDSKDLCTIATPFGKYRYCRAPMGVKTTPDFAQEVMENVLADTAEVDVYIDDIGVFSNDWKQHLQSIASILSRLQDNGFTVNPLKCEGAYKKPIGSVSGLLQSDSNPGKRSSTRYCVFKHLETSKTFVLSLEQLHITVTCIQSANIT